MCFKRHQYMKKRKKMKKGMFELFKEKTDEITTVIYQEDAAIMLELLYGDD